MKVCSKCGEEKALEDYYPREGRCKTCKSEYQRSRKNTHNTSSEYRKSYRNTVTGQRSIKNTQLWMRYRLSIEQYDAMMETQNNSCAVCKRHQSEFVKSFAVDHDHACCPGKNSCGECVRGLLCVNCNMALGQVRDSVDVLKEMIHYIDKNGILPM